MALQTGPGVQVKGAATSKAGRVRRGVQRGRGIVGVAADTVVLPVAADAGGEVPARGPTVVTAADPAPIVYEPPRVEPIGPRGARRHLAA